VTCTRYADAAPYLTKDGSEIRELLHPSRHPVRNQSLAEAIVPPGTCTLRHRHRCSEEIYHVTAGSGTMTLGDESLPIALGDSVLIPPGTPHCVAADDKGPLHLLCSCAPAYDHADTDLL